MRFLPSLAFAASLAVGVPNAAAAGSAGGAGGSIADQFEDVLKQKLPVTSPTQQVATRRVIYESDLAPILVGRSPSPVGYKFVLLATAPIAMEASEETKIRESIPSLLSGITPKIRSMIDKLPEFDPLQTGWQAESLTKGLSSYSQQIKQILDEAVPRIFQDFSKETKSGSLALALRPCLGPACSLAQLAPSASKQSFGQFYVWAISKGLKTVNQAYEIDSKGKFVAIVATLDKEHEWHEDFPVPLLQAAFINAANEARLGNPSLSYTTAELVKLSRENVARLADVFDSPYLAALRVVQNPPTALNGISDELGRARLRDCVRLRGLFKLDEVGKCAGYTLLKQDELANCLANEKCAPAFGKEINFETMLIKQGTSLSDIATSNELPRIHLTNRDNFIKIANKCNDDSGRCLLRETVGKDTKGQRILECIQAAKNGPAVAPCVLMSLSEDQRRKLECLQANSKVAAALCATRGSLPTGTQNILDCLSTLKDSAPATPAKACSFANGSREAACLLQNKDSWTDAALCILGDKIPSPVRDAVRCAQKNPESWEGFGGCVIASQVDGEAQRYAACYIEGHGVPAAIAICLASQNFTQDQRIVLECAAETNANPYATTVCAGGRMAIKEMTNCKGKGFGEGKCFDENNEIRKFSKALGLEIGPKSVVADVINVQLQLTQITYGPMLEVGDKYLPEVLKVIGPSLKLDPGDPRKLALQTGLGPIVATLANQAGEEARKRGGPAISVVSTIIAPGLFK